jgi:transmembrane sensor
MFKRFKRHNVAMPDDDHLHDEQLMSAIEKDMLNNIHRQILGPLFFLKVHKVSYAIAASLLMLCMAAFCLLRFGNQQNMVRITAQKGHISIINLPDGSKIWLNAGSTIEYPQTFAKIRTVQLINGEAFFDVKHDDHKPFVVRYGKMHAQVLGTSFNIKYFNQLNDVRVTVVRGLVEVGNDKQSFGMVTPDKEIIYNKADNSHTARLINSQKVAAWKTRDINLYDVPFKDLVLSIENTYNIHIEYDTKIDNLITTIHFSSTDDLKQVLEIIKTIHGLDYTIRGKEVSLNNK